MMANVAKYSKAACGHLFAHYERAKDETGEYIKFSNQSIDPERSGLNYNLAPDRGMSQGEFIRQRCGEVYCLNRKDVNVMASWVVTAPADLPEWQHDEFFKATYEALADKYGEENVVSAYVHKDENRPHIHFAFVPIVYDNEKDREKVSAKECINKTELRQFHPWLEAEVSRRLGHQVELMNDATSEGNKSIAELKRGTAVQELQETRRAMQEARRELGVLEAEKQREAAISASRASIDEMGREKGVLSKTVQFTRKEAQTLKEMAKAALEVPDLKRQLSSMERVVDDFKARMGDVLQTRIDNARLSKESKELRAAIESRGLVPDQELKRVRASQERGQGRGCTQSRSR